MVARSLTATKISIRVRASAQPKKSARGGATYLAPWRPARTKSRAASRHGALRAQNPSIPRVNSSSRVSLSSSQLIIISPRVLTTYSPFSCPPKFLTAPSQFAEPCLHSGGGGGRATGGFAAGWRAEREESHCGRNSGGSVRSRAGAPSARPSSPRSPLCGSASGRSRDRATRRPSATAIGSSRTGRRWIWTWRTTCSRSPGRTRRTRWLCHHPMRPTGGCSLRSCSTTGHGSSPSGTSRLSLRTSRQPSQFPPTTPSRPSSGYIFPSLQIGLWTHQSFVDDYYLNLLDC